MTLKWTQSELVWIRVVTINYRPLQDDSYHQFLHRFFSKMILTPCHSYLGLGRLGPGDHTGVSPLLKTKTNSKNLHFLTTFLSVRGATWPFFGVEIFHAREWICAHMKNA